MNFHQLFQHVVDDTLGISLAAFRPEVAICVTIVALLLVRMILPRWHNGPTIITLAGSAAALWLLSPCKYLGQAAPAAAETFNGPIFTGMLVSDGFGVFLRALLLGFVLMFTVFTRVTRFPRRADTADFFVLVLGATLGMCLMVSANHMMMVFMGIEMASVPSYILAGMIKEDRRASEAALKYAVYGAAASGVMLYGISLLTGTLGAAQLPAMAAALAEMLQSPTAAENYMILVLGGLMLAVGVAFKLSAVPFHFWTPDVFEGATAEVAAFLSIASKAAALGLLVRLIVGLGYSPEPEALAALAPVRTFIVVLVAVMAAVTCTFGNLAAYGQTNMKRLLAYSTIAHAGYMMMPAAALAAMMGDSTTGAARAAAAIAVYAAIYLFMNLGAFAFTAFVRDRIQSESIDDYAGMVGTSAGAAVCMSLVLFSLVGLPPLAGFAAKFPAFASLFDAGLLALLAVGLINTVISLFYYLRVVKVLVMPAGGNANSHRSNIRLPMTSPAGLYLLAVTIPILVFGVWWNGLFTWADAAAASLF